jgi:hypothetical protein
MHGISPKRSCATHPRQLWLISPAELRHQHTLSGLRAMCRRPKYANTLLPYIHARCSCPQQLTLALLISPFLFDGQLHWKEGSKRVTLEQTQGGTMQTTHYLGPVICQNSKHITFLLPLQSRKQTCRSRLLLLSVHQCTLGLCSLS